MDKFTAITDACEICIDEYVAQEIAKIESLPNDQKKTQAINRILRSAQRVATKPCIRYPCKEQRYEIAVYHNLCAEHLYKMIDIIKEYEDDRKEGL